MNSMPSILIVDDDESIRRTLAMILEERGYTVDTAESGREAIQKSMENFYNLALIDIKLPDMEGTSLLTEMKDTVPKMIKIIMTGYPTLENAIEAVNKGADGYIIKPINVDELLRKIEEHLERQRKERKYSEEKVAEFIESRIRELEQESKRHKQ
ncbi:response regulator [Candidatus Bathyarchaeota archaeon]|nr:response regulator [Candidatus Bathyarchaeota archaeon]